MRGALASTVAPVGEPDEATWESPETHEGPEWLSRQ